MARYTGPKWRINRRENASILGSNEKWKRRPAPPGMSRGGRRKRSDYALQFREKQRVKRTYGMLEKQFRRFYKLAQKAEGNTGTRLLQLLEMRMDNVVYRLGLAQTRAQARQMVVHGHFTLNGKKHNIPSYIMKPGDEINVKPKIFNTEAYTLVLEELKAVKPQEWLERFSNGGKVKAEPTREMMDPGVNERLIIELYSK